MCTHITYSNESYRSKEGAWSGFRKELYSLSSCDKWKLLKQNVPWIRLHSPYNYFFLFICLQSLSFGCLDVGEMLLNVSLIQISPRYVLSLTIKRANHLVCHILQHHKHHAAWKLTFKQSINHTHSRQNSREILALWFQI